MKYCSKCRHLHNDEDALCKFCGGSLKDVTEDNTPVYLLTARGFELQRVRAALEDCGVPCDASLKKSVANKYNAKAVTGYDDSEYDLSVPYAAYEKAFDTCVGIGAIKLEGEEISDDRTLLEDDGAPTLDEQFEEMSGTKRTTVRVVSAILLILIVAAVIYGTDYIMNLIKGLFS